MADTDPHREKNTRAIAPDDAPHMSFEIRSVDGEEAEGLRLQQTRVIREVVEWLAQKRSRSGQQDNAA